MSKHACSCAASAPPIELDVHRRIRLRRLGLQGAVARTVADLAFGEPRNAAVVVAVADVGSLTAGGRQ